MTSVEYKKVHKLFEELFFLMAERCKTASNTELPELIRTMDKITHHFSPSYDLRGKEIIED